MEHKGLSVGVHVDMYEVFQISLFGSISPHVCVCVGTFVLRQCVAVRL